MPEGDTIYRTAKLLRDALIGRTLIRFETPRPVPGIRPEPGEQIGEVRSRGKHLLVRFSSGTTLHTHMRMTGVWRVFASGEPGRKSPSQVRVVIETQDVVAACFSAPVVELLTDADIRRHPALAALGADLCDPDPDLDDALRRMAGLVRTTPIGEALLDQRVAAGVGNVYRSEVLWLCEIDPFATLADVPEPARRALLQTAHRQLRRNLGPGPRRTVPSGLAVYNRAGRPCLRCGSRIQVRRSGEQARSTWWCPACQGPHGPPPGN
jgi:endonuclease-8